MSAHDEIAAIDAEIAVLEKKFSEVTGRNTEVYSRIVGYYRSVVNWNLGKKSEFDARKTFDMPEKLKGANRNELL